ncbi:MAG TPA: RNA polymerase sigma factor [Candidatus Binataceae bacterium]|nr:RNA polymerase sigma factor [Candidatus Binataceae bacterium]
MRLSQAGDREAFRELVNDIGPAIMRFLRRRIADAGELEDACQEALLAIYQSRHTYQPGRPVEPWLFAIARYVGGRHAKNAWARIQWQELSDDSDDQPAQSNHGLRLVVRQAMGQLPDSQREAFTMLKIEGLSLAEASERTGISIGTLKVRAHRAYEFLKKTLRP